MAVATPNVTTRFVAEADESAVLEVLDRAFGGWPAIEVAVPHIDHLRWKMSSSPKARRSQVLSELEGRIAGAQLLLEQRVRIGGETFTARQTVDNAVDPQYQGRGLLNAMRRVRDTQLDSEFDVHIGGFGTHPAIRTLRPRIPQPRTALGNRVEALTQLPPLRPGLLRRPLRAARYVRLAIERSIRASRAPRVDASWAIERVERFGRQFDVFWEDAAAPFDFIVVRDSEWLNWRYDRRAGLFEAWVAVEAGRVLGYVVARPSHGVGHIADLLVLPRRLDVARSLVRHAVRRLRELAVERIECWLPAHHPYRSVVRELGLVHKRRTIPLDCRPLRVPREPLRFLRGPRVAVHFTSGDSDFV